jgi:hypothetical protein
VHTAKTYIARCITLIVALQLLNLSIYAQDFKPIHNESGSDETNITETIVEYVVEVMLGHKNAIPEQSQHHSFHKHLSFKAIKIGGEYRLADLPKYCSVTNVPLMEPYDYLYLQEINPPPPKA